MKPAEGGGGPYSVGRVRALRPPKPPGIDPRRPLGVTVEEERIPGGGTARAITLFLAGAECPFTCVYCDLWKHTLDGPTPAGAIPAQLEAALAELPRSGSGGRGFRGWGFRDAIVKLYNASNFFEARAVPREDDAAVARLTEDALRVVVECHPLLVRGRCRAFAERLGEGRLEVAMGLETVHPEALPRLGKGMSLDDFDRAAARLLCWGASARAFVLVGAPFVPPEESVEWAVRSVEHAFEVGVTTVALIPVRGANGAMEELRAAGEWRPPTFAELERAVEECGRLSGIGGERVVTADLWDLPALASCPACADARIARLGRFNLSGRLEPRVECGQCGGE